MSAQIPATWVDAKGLAEHLPVSRRTLGRLMAAGLPSLRLGRKRIFDLVAVDRWIRARGKAGR